MTEERREVDIHHPGWGGRPWPASHASKDVNMTRGTSMLQAGKMVCISLESQRPPAPHELNVI